MGRNRKKRPEAEKYRKTDPRTIYVENLPPSFTKVKVETLFSTFAQPTRVYFDEAKLFAFVEFENQNIASSVLTLAKNKYKEFDIKPAVQKTLKPEAEKSHKLIVDEASYVKDKWVDEETAMPISRVNSYSDPDSFIRERQEAIKLALEAVYWKREKAKSLGQGRCHRCNSAATKQCGDCKVFYCSEKCQRIDWELGGHAELCSENFRNIFPEEPAIIPRQRFYNKSKDSDRVSEKPPRKPERRETEKNKFNSNGYDDDSERGNSPKKNSRGRNDDRKKSFDDQGARPKSQNRCEDSYKEGNELTRDSKSDNRSSRGGRDARRPLSEKNDNKRDSDEEENSWGRGNDRKSKNESSRLRDSPRRRSPSPERKRSTPPKRQSPERRLSTPPRRRSPDRRQSSPPKRRSPERRQSTPPKSRSPERRQSSPTARRLEFEEKKEKTLTMSPEVVKKDSPKMKEPEVAKAQGKSAQNLDVIGLVRESKDSYWVFKVSDLDEWQDLQTTLNDICPEASPAKPEIGLVCGCFYDEMWYRGQIVSIEPKLKVHYIDFGNTSECGPNIKKLPERLCRMPGLAFLIKFDKGTPDKYETNELDGETFSIKLIKKTESFYLVRIAGEDYSSVDVEVEEKKEPPKKRMSAQSRLAALAKPKRRHVWDSVKESANGLLHITSGIGRTVYGCLVPADEGDAVTCFDEIGTLEIPKQPAISANRGDFVLASNGQELVGRGEVICLAGDSYIVNLVDYGQCVKNKEVYPLPDQVKDYLEIGVKVQITEIFQQKFDVKYVQNEETYYFEVTGPCEDEKWPCLIKTTDDNPVKVASGLLSKWKCPVVPLSYVPIESGASVILSTLDNVRTGYVKPISKDCDKKLDEINEKISKYCSKAKLEPKEPPTIGQLVCARFEDDGNYYRAVVESIKGDLFTVRFVDYGNKQKTKLDDIVPMLKELMEYPCYAIKVHLKLMDKNISCPQVIKYLSTLSEDSVELILTHNDNEVTLTEKLSKINVNEYAKSKIDAFNK